jgi:hypothetical protein
MTYYYVFVTQKRSKAIELSTVCKFVRWTPGFTAEKTAQQPHSS